MTRFPVVPKTKVVFWIAIALLTTSVAHAEKSEVLVDNFDDRVEGRWEPMCGGDWEIGEGRCSKKPDEGEYQKSILVCDFPITEGSVETTIQPDTKRSASLGIVGKYIDKDRHWYVRIVYWQLNLEVHVEGQKSLRLGPYSLWNKDNDTSVEPVRLKLVMRGGRGGLFVNGILRCMFHDPLAGEAGKPGIFTNSASTATLFTVHRTK